MTNDVAYMCKTDFDHHLGFDMDGTTSYPSIEALKKARPCVEECGIVEVEVTLRKVIQESTF